MELGRIYSTLKSYRRWLIASAFFFACCALCWRFAAAPAYSAKALVVVEPAGNGAAGLQAFTFSQIEIATSERVLLDAAKRLSPATRIGLSDTPEAADDPFRAAGVLRRAVNVTVGRDSTVLQIAATARNAQAAADMANAVASAYMQVSLSLKNEPARQRAAFYQSRVDELQTAALEAQDQVASFQQRSGLVSPSAGRGDVEQAVLGELIRRTSELRAQYLGSAAGRSETPANPNASAEVLKSAVVQALQIDLARAKTRLQELETRLGKNHPQYQAAAGELAQLQRSLDHEVALAAASVTSAGRADTRSADKLSEIVEKQKSVIVDLTAKREQLAVLQQRAEYARKSFEAMRDRLGEALIESRSNIGAANLLAAATPPRDSNAAPLQRTMPLAALLGVVFAGFGAVAREHHRPRLRAQADLQRLGHRPVAWIPTASRKSVRSTQPVQARLAFAAMPAQDRRLGALLFAAGRLSAADRQAVYDEHVRRSEPFGSVAVQMGVLSQADVQEALSAQYGLRRVHPAAGAGLAPEQFVVDQHPSHPVAEAIRVLRSHLMLMAERRERPLMVAVTSPDRGDGKSFIAANLAIALSQSGMRTLLVEADMRDPQLAARFGSSRREGLSSHLAGLIPEAPILPLDDSATLSLLPAGPIPPNPQELLCRPAFAALMQSIGQRFEAVVVDTPANAVGSDAQIIAARAGSAVVVGRWNETSLDGLALLGKRLADAGVDTVGAIVNHYDGPLH